MIRILELELEHFGPILSGTGKEKIRLDLRSFRNRIFIFIGKIGSAKTYILSHLQPYSTVGTLDVRNVDDPILPEKDGMKRIVYEKDTHIIEIKHTYTWTGSSHTKKAYIKKDDVELNPNGNRTSFEELVQLELGIDPSFLRLLRLGPNVTNFINMKSTERKSFIASLLSETEVYLMLYKYWSQELRTLNTSVSILMNKLNSFGKETMEELEATLEDLNDDAITKKEKVDRASEQKYQLEGEIKTLLQNQPLEIFSSIIANEEYNLHELQVELEQMEDILKTFEEYPDITEISKEIGKYDSALNISLSTLKALEEE